MSDPKNGWVLVPREPTRPMLEAMCKRRGIDPTQRTLDVLDHLTVNVLADSIADYRAMVGAASGTSDPV